MSAFKKEPVTGPVMLRSENLDGDKQADPRVHGGPDQAVLCYCAEHYACWRAELGIPEIGAGGFGENFTISGADEWTTCVGDVYRVGQAVVQVSQPRGPCYKISWRWEREDLLARVEASGRHGWYLRVLETGLVAPGDELSLIQRPHPEWTVRQVADTYRARKRDREAAARLATLSPLSRQWRARLRATVSR